MSYSSEVLADSPIAYWRLGESAGTTAVSEVNTPALDGTYVNTPTLGVQGALSGDSNTAVTFTASSSERITVSDNALLQVADVLTAEAWIKRASTGTKQYILSQHVGALEFYMDTDDLLTAFKHSDAQIVKSTISITDTTTWHHCVYTKNGATSALYINGVDRTGTVTNQTLTDQNNFRIACNTSDAVFWDGSLDEVAWYGTALSAARVLDHYEAATTWGIAWITA